VTVLGLQGLNGIQLPLNGATWPARMLVMNATWVLMAVVVEVGDRHAHQRVVAAIGDRAGEVIAIRFGRRPRRIAWSAGCTAG
jgi:hypothetical protein